MTTLSTWLEALLSTALFIPLHEGAWGTGSTGEPGAGSHRVGRAGKPRRALPGRDDFRLSVLIPFRHEWSAFAELHRRLEVVLEGVVGGPHEIVLLDTEPDGAPLELPDAARDDRRVVVVRPRPSAGEDEALAAAMSHAAGDAAVLMEGDLRHPPEAIRDLLEKYREGYDLICARTERRQIPWWRWFYGQLRARLSVLDAPSRWRRFSLVSSGVLDEVRRAPDPGGEVRRLRESSSARAAFNHVCISVTEAVTESGAGHGPGESTDP